jgi:hypothetical protein
VYREPLSASNLLLRGCTLRKTEWGIGAVIFTGQAGCCSCSTQLCVCLPALHPPTYISPNW